MSYYNGYMANNNMVTLIIMVGLSMTDWQLLGRPPPSTQVSSHAGSVSQFFSPWSRSAMFWFLHSLFFSSVSGSVIFGCSRIQISRFLLLDSNPHFVLLLDPDPRSCSYSLRPDLQYFSLESRSVFLLLLDSDLQFFWLLGPDPQFFCSCIFVCFFFILNSNSVWFDSSTLFCFRTLYLLDPELDQYFYLLLHPDSY